MVTYKGINIPEQIIIVEKPLVGANPTSTYPEEEEERIPQGYVVLPNNPNMLKSAMSWATTSCYARDEFGEYIYDDDDKPGRYLMETRNGIEHTYTNGTFTLEMYDSANRSSQGGKLSFWNCLITAEDGSRFIIGIDADLLLNLLQFAEFKQGKCLDKIFLGRQGSHVGVYTATMPDYLQAQIDLKFKTLKPTTKYQIGDIIKSKSQTLIYLGEHTEYFSRQALYTVGESPVSFSYLRPSQYSYTKKFASAQDYAFAVDRQPYTRHYYMVTGLDESSFTSTEFWEEAKRPHNKTYIISEVKKLSRVVVGHVTGISPEDTSIYWQYLLMHALSRASYYENKYINSLGAFLRWCEKQGLDPESPEARKTRRFYDLDYWHHTAQTESLNHFEYTHHLLLEIHPLPKEDIIKYLNDALAHCDITVPADSRGKGGKIVKAYTIDEHIQHLNIINSRITGDYTGDHAYLSGNRAHLYDLK